ncbi:amidohydrolase [Pseudophaeobacter sp.]|jgi:amidohydrolase|uniref:amidohydrolase n=1 Tax=Pseudophaeobacter sp. TaxID=1971739 RepID=UPI0025E8764F|nr:amidohydrolase [uncultured Pseudophaeobacter sp.]
MTAVLTNTQLAYLQSLRQALHQSPEISGEEVETAARITQELTRAGADRVWTGLGGHGVAAEFCGQQDGPTVLIRCELDALPIPEISQAPYRSQIEGKGHLCGHDGHMVMVLGVALALKTRPATGRVILLFQPAEETGAGAAAVINDPRWPELRPDFAFAYHNVPGRPLGEIGLCSGVSNCASRGMKIRFGGKTSHAAAPEDGVSPAGVIADLMQSLPVLGPGGDMGADFALATLTHAQLGEASFGIAPGAGELRMTLRSQTDARMDRLVQEAEAQLERALAKAAQQAGRRAEHVSATVSATVTWHDVFLATVNDDRALTIASTAASTLGLSTHSMGQPMRWSEDFGRFGLDGAKAAMVFIGSGESQPQLHNPNYDYPDGLTPTGVALLVEIIDQLLGRQGDAHAQPNISGN